MNESEAIVKKKTLLRLHQLYKQEDSLPPLLLLNPTEKNSDTSNKFRVEGHSHFLNQCYVNAIELYNQSMCHAVISGDKFDLSMSLGHRAEAYFKMKSFQECLSSIKLALRNSYPEKFKKRMTILQRKCEEGLADGPKKIIDYSLKLSYTANPRRPFMIGALRLAVNDQYGRHLITERDLQVGDVIAIENSYLIELNPMDRYKRCSFCLSDKRHDLYPCSFCTNAMFCSQKCEKDSWTVHHRYECSITNYLMAIEPGARVALKALLTGLHLFKDFNAMKQFLYKSNENKVDSVFHPDYRHSDPRDRFLAYYNLFSTDQLIDKQLQNENMKRAAEILRVLKHQNELSEKMDSEEIEKFLLSFLYHCICIHLNNGYEMDTCLPRSHSSSPIGVGVFLGFSLASHSCAPNVMRLQKGASQYWVVNRPIQKGGQVFDNYGVCFLKHPLEMRQQNCWLHYGFTCQCLACEKDFPLEEKISISEHVPCINLLNETIADYQDSKALLKQLDKVANFMQAYGAHYPCQQLIQADNVLWNIYRRILDDVSMELKFIQFYKPQ